METCPRCGVPIPTVALERVECPAEPEAAELDRLTDRIEEMTKDTIASESSTWSEVLDV